MKVLYVEWVDSCTSRGWDNLDKSGPVLIRSVGIRVHRDANSLVLSTSKSGSGRYVDQITIPASAIKKVRRVKI